MFNKLKKQKLKTAKEREEKCVPIAKDILKLIGNFECELVGLSPQETQKAHDPLIKEILAVLLKYNIALGDISYVMQMVEARFNHVQQWTSASVNQNVSSALQMMWGKHEDEVSFEDIEAVFEKNKK